MGEFCRGWRRKIGLVTMAMACVAMGGWIRSQFIEDGIYLCPFNGLTAFVESANQSFFGAVYLDLKNVSSFADGLSWQSRPIDSSSGGRKLLANKNYIWHLRTCGFALGKLVTSELEPSTGKITFTSHGPSYWIIPYWSITVPLTLISFWLLLSKSRISNHTKGSEHGTADGA